MIIIPGIMVRMYDPTLYAPDELLDGAARSPSAIPSLGIYIHRQQELEYHQFVGNYHRRVLPYLNQILFVERAAAFAKFLLAQVLVPIDNTIDNPDSSAEDINSSVTPQLSESAGSLRLPFPAPFIEEFLDHAPRPLQQFVLDQLPVSKHPFRALIMENLYRKDLPSSHFSLI
ncbi:MAG: hypothetical protein ACTSYI_05340 [Promethearchaeota archaeon]